MVDMDNVGSFPVNGSTDVGRFRALAGDSVPFERPIDGATEAEYRYWSDIEIQLAIDSTKNTAGEVRLTPAIATAYNSLALQLAVGSKKVKDYDLQVDNSSAAEAVQKLAKVWSDKAAIEEADEQDFFYSVPVNVSRVGSLGWY